ncbi:MAG TPA: ABC transporter ATP-binding protein, partial [Candidatus Baltobacteraceae bacterium]|nr:ABC transporter ATP-binding protein [Candidatus Baltobacteraceae bacterium]
MAQRRRRHGGRDRGHRHFAQRRFARGARGHGSLTASEPRIALRGLRKRFASGTLALDGIDLEVADGEFVAIVGPSGCGKTTLLRIAAGLETASEGSALVRAQDARAGTLPTAMVFQERSLFPWMRVRENVDFAFDRVALPASERRARVDEQLARVGLLRFAQAYPRELSGGMSRRVAVARAFAVDPRVLFMDEPFGALDEQTRVGLGVELAKIWESSRKTVLFVTHSIEEALALADRVVVMTAAPGRIAEILAV